MPESFIETPRFPDCISYGSSGGPTFLTDIQSLESGHEQRNAAWSIGRHRYNAAYGLKTLTDLEALRSWMHVTLGRAYGFRFKDQGEYKSCDPDAVPDPTDQLLGVGDAVGNTFQLIKRYVVGAHERVRPIHKPVEDSVVLAVNGTPLLASEFTVDTATGIVTLGTAPAVAYAVSAGFEFDVPVRFDIDEFDVTHEAFELGSASCNLIEIRPYPVV